MQAYLNDPELKRKLVQEIRKHEVADQVVSGTYGEIRGGRWVGCAIGCALHSLNQVKQLTDNGYNNTATNVHTRFPAELGIPVELAYHIDCLFENLPPAERKTWPRRVAQAITPGADLEGVIPALLQWMLLDPKAGLISLVTAEGEQATLRAFATLVARDWAGDTVTSAQWEQIGTALDKILMWASVRAGAWAGARAGARAGAWAGAWASVRAGAWAGAGAVEYTQLSQQTLKLLRAAK